MAQLKLETPMDLIPLIQEEAQKCNVRLRLGLNSDGVAHVYSVIDTIRALCWCDAQEAAKKYSNLVDNVKIGVIPNYQFPGQGQRLTHAATPMQLLKIIQALDGNRYPLVGKFKNMCNEILVHVGGANPALGRAILAQNGAFNRGEVPIDAPIQAFRLESAAIMSETTYYENNIKHNSTHQSAIDVEKHKLELEERRIAIEERKAKLRIDTGKAAIENMRNITDLLNVIDISDNNAKLMRQSQQFELARQTIAIISHMNQVQFTPFENQCNADNITPSQLPIVQCAIAQQLAQPQVMSQDMTEDVRADAVEVPAALANPEITFEDVAAAMQPPIEKAWVRKHAAIIGRNISIEYQKVHGKKSISSQTVTFNGKVVEIKTYHESDREIIKKVLRTMKANDDLPTEVKEEIKRCKNREAQARAKAKRRVVELAAATVELESENSQESEQSDA